MNIARFLGPFVLAGALFEQTLAASAEDKLIVRDEYQASCQVCHGEGGKGDGPMTGVLKVKPADLTQLAKKNDGKFPFLRVFQIIDGRSVVPAHGTRDMPVWGRSYMANIGEKYGPYGGEAAIRARVLELVYFVQSLQGN